MKFVQNRIVQNIYNFEFFDEKYKILNFLIESVYTIIEDVSIIEKYFITRYQNINLQTIVCNCTKNYGNPTCTTKLKTTPNMANLISLNKNLP